MGNESILRRYILDWASIWNWGSNWTWNWGSIWNWSSVEVSFQTGHVLKSSLLSLTLGLRFFYPEIEISGFLDMPIFESVHFLTSDGFFQKWLPRPNHYAHEVGIEILCRTPVSILRDLSSRPQNHMKTSKYSSLAWMSTWISRWRRRPWRRADNLSIWPDP